MVEEFYIEIDDDNKIMQETPEPEAAPEPANDFTDPQPEYIPDTESTAYAAFIYIAGIAGIITALLADGTSEFTRFHVTQGIKFSIVQILSTACLLVFCWIPIVKYIWTGLWGCWLLLLFVCRIISAMRAFRGEMRAPVLIDIFFPEY